MESVGSALICSGVKSIKQNLLLLLVLIIKLLNLMSYSIHPEDALERGHEWVWRGGVCP